MEVHQEYLINADGHMCHCSDMASQSATLHDAEPPKILVFAHHR